MPSFHDMEMRYGPAAAYQCLTEIEKVAGVSSWEMIEIDPEIRLSNALRMQDTARSSY